MCGNRVEELEERVNELEASVEGLTDELVECKVRIRELEAAVDDDVGPMPAEATDDESETNETAGSDIRVPDEGEPTGAADTSNTEGAEDSDEAEESGTDIIVA